MEAFKAQKQPTPFKEVFEEQAAHVHNASQFIDFSNFRTYKDRRSYTEQRMIELINAGELSLTNILTSYTSLRDVAGDVILGITYSNGGQEVCNVPYEIATATISVKSLTDKNLDWHDGMRVNRSLSPTPQTDAFFRSKGRSAEEKRRYSAESTEAELPLRQAWKILKQNGLHIKWSETKLNQELRRPLELRRQIVGEFDASNEAESAGDQGAGSEAKKVRGRGKRNPSD